MIKKKEVKGNTVAPLNTEKILRPVKKKDLGVREVKYRMYRFKGDLL